MENHRIPLMSSIEDFLASLNGDGKVREKFLKDMITINEAGDETGMEEDELRLLLGSMRSYLPSQACQQGAVLACRLNRFNRNYLEMLSQGEMSSSRYNQIRRDINNYLAEALGSCAEKHKN